jgi:hypothetical protein
MAEEKDETGVTRFDCGCVLTCAVIEGQNTATLEACDNPACFVRAEVERQTRAQGKEPIYGRKDVEH